MSLFNKDTIVALATAPLAAGVAVLRLSGPKAKEATTVLCPSFENIPSRKMHYGELKDNKGNVLDKVLMVYFKNPHSFTGEDVVEIHGHGGMAVVDGVTKALLAQEGVRHAEAGEFSRRAFLNNKMDLTEAEGLADLIAAETEEQKKQALRQMDGQLGQQFEEWRTSLMHLVAHVEAAIDFPDEELDILAEEGIKSKIEENLNVLRKAVDSQVGERLRDGFQIVILGKPNAGKSTLTNLLSGKDAAIVSPIAGTTRDVVETHLNIAGFPVVLADTAGLRITEDIIEAEGVKRATAKAQKADLTVVVTDAAEWPGIDEQASSQLRAGGGIVVVSKVDETAVDLPKQTEVGGHTYPVIGCDLTADHALDTILDTLAELIRMRFAKTQGAAQLNRERHRAAVRDAITHLDRALELCKNPEQAFSVSELLAQDLRDAAMAIGTVTGKTGSEDVLDVVFSTFCIGK